MSLSENELSDLFGLRGFKSKFWSCCGLWSGLGASLDVPFLCLSRLLSGAEAVPRTATKRVHQRHRVDRVAASAPRAPAAGGSPVAAAGRSCLSCCARSSAPAAAPTGADRDAADPSALAPRTGSMQVDAATA